MSVGLELIWQIIMKYMTYRLSTVDFQKKFFFKKVSIFEEKKRGFIIRKKVFFALAISDFRGKKGFAFKKTKFFSCTNFLHSFRLVTTSHNSREPWVSLWLISLHAQDGALFLPPDRRHTVKQRGLPIKDMVCT